MNRKVKPRRYESPLRADQASATRRAIVEAAARLFAERGYAAVSVDDIAAVAAVSRATVFAAAGGKPQLLTAAYRSAFGLAAGDAQKPMPLVERPRSREIRAQKTIAAYLDGYLALAVELARRLGPLHDVIREAARSAPEVGALWQVVNDERRRGAATIVADIMARAPLRAGLNEVEAADVVWMLNDPNLYNRLVRERGWSEARFSEWLRALFERELVGRPSRR